MYLANISMKKTVLSITLGLLVSPAAFAADYTTAIGFEAETTADYATAVGAGSVASHANSVALGSGSVTSTVNEVSVGGQVVDGVTTKRVISNVAVGSRSSDAATVGQVNAVSASISAGDSSTLVSANAHADSGDSDTLNSAKAYADAGDANAVSTAKAYADSGDSNTLTSAKSYADTGDSNTLNSANGYTDGEISAMRDVMNTQFSNMNSKFSAAIAAVAAQPILPAVSEGEIGMGMGIGSFAGHQALSIAVVKGLSDVTAAYMGVSLSGTDPVVRAGFTTKFINK